MMGTRAGLFTKYLEGIWDGQAIIGMDGKLDVRVMF
jgi:hypothetical protein